MLFRIASRSCSFAFAFCLPRLVMPLPQPPPPCKFTRFVYFGSRLPCTPSRLTTIRGRSHIVRLPWREFATLRIYEMLLFPFHTLLHFRVMPRCQARTSVCTCVVVLHCKCVCFLVAYFTIWHCTAPIYDAGSFTCFVLLACLFARSLPLDGRAL